MSIFHASDVRLFGPPHLIIGKDCLLRRRTQAASSGTGQNRLPTYCQKGRCHPTPPPFLMMLCYAYSGVPLQLRRSDLTLPGQAMPSMPSPSLRGCLTISPSCQTEIPIRHYTTARRGRHIFPKGSVRDGPLHICPYVPACLRSYMPYTQSVMSLPSTGSAELALSLYRPHYSFIYQSMSAAVASRVR